MIDRCAALTVLLVALFIACDGNPGGDANAGAQVYTTQCGTCHGAGGTGLNTGSPTMSGSDLTQKVPEMSDREIEDAILKGSGDMAPLPLTDEQVEDVTAYMRDKWN